MSDSPRSVSVVCDEWRPPLPRCPLCKKSDWSRPIKVLDCGHSFCQSCLQSVYSRRRERVAWWNKLSHFLCIKCPQCKGRTSMPWIHLKQLRTNYDFQHFLDAYYAGRPPSTEIPDQLDDTASEQSEESSRLIISPIAMTVWISGSDDERGADMLSYSSDADAVSSDDTDERASLSIALRLRPQPRLDHHESDDASDDTMADLNNTDRSSMWMATNLGEQASQGDGNPQRAQDLVRMVYEEAPVSSTNERSPTLVQRVDSDGNVQDLCRQQ